MKNCILLLIAVCILFLPTVYAQSEAGNEVIGEVSIAVCGNRVSQGRGYNKDGTEVMHSNDPLAQVDRNVIVSLHPLDFEPELTPTPDAVISQRQQTFIPHVLPIVVGSRVYFLNEDEFFHNVQSYTPRSRFSIGRRAPGISYSISIEKTGVVNLSCDIHQHMNARILSFDTPYFCRLEEDGTYRLNDLPDGRYRIQIYHPVCDPVSEEVEIQGGKVFEFDYELNSKD